ncbi:hypothetical protein HK100_007114 [Physocladia obscura]|uniref:FYVE-type domain-containing protein n=1 Tax=Physocladia obscura TaxID=109957 RepID=A0AAD5SR37_9FUNG|nr:hypothetical protein HK100_007114 [Physocladia obscura]
MSTFTGGSERVRRLSNPGQSPSPSSIASTVVGSAAGRMTRQLGTTGRTANITSINTPLSFVTGPPQRTHWKPDALAVECEGGCGIRFGLVTRRHHCRTCGGVFCGACSHFRIRLDQNAEPHPHGLESRICHQCHKEFVRRALLVQSPAVLVNNNPKTRDFTQALPQHDVGIGIGISISSPPTTNINDIDAASDTDASDNGDALHPITLARSVTAPLNFNRRPSVSIDEIPVAQSVPSDWSWSTF